MNLIKVTFFNTDTTVLMDTAFLNYIDLCSVKGGERVYVNSGLESKFNFLGLGKVHDLSFGIRESVDNIRAQLSSDFIEFNNNGRPLFVNRKRVSSIGFDNKRSYISFGDMADGLCFDEDFDTLCEIFEFK